MSSPEKQKIRLVSAKDCDISYSVGSGNGGQAKQRTNSKATVIHRESGAIGYCSESRSQLENKKAAFKRMTETTKFKFWLNKKLYELQNSETMEEAVEREMSPENLKIEVLNENGRWVLEDENTQINGEPAH